MRIKKKGYTVLLILSIVFAIAAVKTAIPNPDAGKDCMLGYRTHCSFTPVSTVVCLALVGACCVIRRRACTTEE